MPLTSGRRRRPSWTTSCRTAVPGSLARLGRAGAGPRSPAPPRYERGGDGRCRADDLDDVHVEQPGAAAVAVGSAAIFRHAVSSEPSTSCSSRVLVARYDAMPDRHAWSPRRSPPAPARCAVAGSSADRAGRDLAGRVPDARGPSGSAGARPRPRSCDGGSRCTRRGSSSRARSRSARSGRRSWSGRARRPGCARAARAGRTRSSTGPARGRRATPGGRRGRGAGRPAAPGRRRPIPSVLGAPQQGPQARQQLVELERLRQVVVGTGVETGDAIAGLGARREHEDRHPVAVGAQHLAHGEPVDDRHRHVEHDDVGLRAARRRRGPRRRCRPR